MQRQVADIRTRFAVVGLDGVQAAFRSTADVLGRVTRISRQSGQAAGAAGQASQDAARRAAEAARAQVQAAARAAQEQLRQAQQAAQRQSQLARQQAAERIRLAREAAAQAQRDAAEAARRASGARGPTPSMDPAQAAAARAARDLAQQQARDAAALARARAQAYQDELRQARVRAAQADREARRQVQAAQAAARAAAEAASRQARQDAADAAARIRLIREEAAQRQAQARAEAAARQAQIRADAQATAARVRALRDLARQQAEADRQRQAALRAQAQADEAAARAAVAAARAATGAQRAAARQAARDALERLRRSRDAARQADEEARRRQAELQRQADAETRIQRERERRAREQSRRELADIRARAAADLRAEREAERARRNTERQARSAGQANRRNADERRQGEQRVAGAVRETTADIGRQEKAAGRLAGVFAKLGGLAKGVSVKKLVIGAAAGAGIAGLPMAAYGLAAKATAGASEYARTTNNASLSTGLDLQIFSVYADLAKKFDVQVDDLRGSLIQFQGVIGEVGRAGAGDETFDALARLGVNLSPINGKLRTTSEVLLPILNALKTMPQTERISMMSKLFGEGDAGKLDPFFQALLKDPTFITKGLARQNTFGNFINKRDLAIAQQYKSAVEDMADAWRGLELEVANIVGPGVSSVLAAAAQDLGRNRVLIAQAFGKGVQWLGSVAGDVLNMSLKGSAYDAYVKNRWLLPAREAFATIGRIARATFRLVGEAYQTVMGNDAAVKEFPWLITIRNGLTSAYTLVVKFARDLFNVITFRDYNVSGAFPWMTTIRDQVVAFVEYIKRVWADLQNVWSGGDSASTGPAQMLLRLVQGFEAAKVYIDGWVVWFRTLGADIAHVWEQIGNPEKDKAFNFAWMKSMADGFWFVADAAKQGYEWFKKVYDTIFAFVKEYTGLNFESMLFFVAFLKFSGTLFGLSVVLGLVLKPFKLLAALVMAIGGAGAAAGTITSLAAAWAGLQTALAGVAAFATNPLVMAIIGGVAGGVALGSWLKGGVIDKAITELERWISDFDNSPGVKKLREMGENPTDAERFRGQVRAGTQQMSDWPAWQQQQREYDRQAAEWQQQLARERQTGDALYRMLNQPQQQAANAPRNSVTINLPDGRQVQASQSDDQYAQLLRDFRRAQ